MASAGRPPAASSATAPLAIGGGYRVRFDETGAWRLESDGGPLFVQCGLRIWSRTGYLRQADARVASPPAVGPTGRTFGGTLRVGSHTVRYWQTATPVPDGLLMEYAVAAPDLAPTEEIAAGFDLPVETFRGAVCSVAEAASVKLPEAPPTDPRLIEREAGALVLRRNGQVFCLQRRPAGKIIVQDGRQWHMPCFQALLYASRGVGDPEGWRSVTFLLTVGGEPSGPLLAAVAPGAERLPCYDIHEAEARFWAPYDNPYRDAEVRLWADVTAPSGRQARVPGFFARDYERSLDGDAERLSPVGHGRWRVRLAPTEVGTYSYTVKVATPAGTAASKPLSFEATAPTRRGFLRSPRKQARYLEDAGGQPCFLIGHNFCWPPANSPTRALDLAFDRMARHGINATRLWLCTWGIRIEGKRPDDYRLDDAWRLDHILRIARERGMYVQLSLDNFTDLTAAEKAAENPYLAANGGPCRNAAQFFTSPKAREQYRRRLGYLVARYAPFASVLGWELCNELDYASPNRRDPALLAWVRDSASWLRQNDAYAHPVTVSLGLRSTWDELWQLPELDMIQAHVYMNRPVSLRDRDERDAAALVLRERDRHAAFAKPFLVAEFGFLGTSDFNPLNEADKTGVHLHNALWASALSGAAGTALHWWWDSYIQAHDLYYHYAALEKFLRGEPLPGADWNPLRDKGTGPIRVLGLKSATAALLWIQHRDNNWYRRIVERQAPTPLPAAGIDLGSLTEGRYRVEWWDTYAGELITHAVLATREGALVLRPPAGFPDVACKVRRIGD